MVSCVVPEPRSFPRNPTPPVDEALSAELTMRETQPNTDLSIDAKETIPVLPAPLPSHPFPNLLIKEPHPRHIQPDVTAFLHRCREALLCISEKEKISSPMELKFQDASYAVGLEVATCRSNPDSRHVVVDEKALCLSHNAKRHKEGTSSAVYLPRTCFGLDTHGNAVLRGTDAAASCYPWKCIPLAKCRDSRLQESQRESASSFFVKFLFSDGVCNVLTTSVLRRIGLAACGVWESDHTDLEESFHCNIRSALKETASLNEPILFPYTTLLYVLDESHRQPNVSHAVQCTTPPPVPTSCIRFRKAKGQNNYFPGTRLRTLSIESNGSAASLLIAIDLLVQLVLFTTSQTPRRPQPLRTDVTDCSSQELAPLPLGSSWISEFNSCTVFPPFYIAAPSVVVGRIIGTKGLAIRRLRRQTARARIQISPLFLTFTEALRERIIGISVQDDVREKSTCLPFKKLGKKPQGSTLPDTAFSRSALQSPLSPTREFCNLNSEGPSFEADLVENIYALCKAIRSLVQIINQYPARAARSNVIYYY